MWPLIVRFLLSPAASVVRQRALTVVGLPVAVVLGAIGLGVEKMISDRYTPGSSSSIENRLERLADEEVSKKDPTAVDNLIEKKFVPKTIFEKNVPPSLQN